MAPKQRIRQRFGSIQDYLLVVQVKTDLPFCAPHGELMAGWKKVATTLNSCDAFKLHHLKGLVVKNRFERLVGRHRSWVKNSSLLEDVPSQDAAFQSVMAELVPKLDAAEAEPLIHTLGKRGRPQKIWVSQVAIAPPPLGPQPSSSSSLLVDPEDQALPIVSKASCQRFTPEEDLLFVKFVKESLPFRAKFGAISAAWEDVTNKLDNSPKFSKDCISRIVRYRFENLVTKYRERVKRNNGRVVGPKGTRGNEVLMTKLVTLMDGGDPISAALLAQNVAIATDVVTTVAARELPRTSTSQDEGSIITTSEPSSPASSGSEGAPGANRSFTTPTPQAEPTVVPDREERRMEAERREREFEIQRKERKKDHEVLTATVMSALKTFLEQVDRNLGATYMYTHWAGIARVHLNDRLTLYTRLGMV
ncbi:unnamed protein product [Peronospora destructor]|uniref:Myb-like domain-containing protein n=1 Tax=Peronospora destructor TaxID=86335 RepID=A0AAV0TGL2_9STRA|nr:unnamed protein product [Peronospora destructor]